MQQKIRKIFLSVLPFFAVFIPILLGVPQSAQALERRRLIPVGRTVGVTMDTEGLLVLETGGIVQGMSGSPILQDGKLVGAVTHVTLADPTKGYGIFMENMAA